MNIKFRAIAVPGCGEETSDWDSSEFNKIEIEQDGTLVIYTTDDSTCTYMPDEWTAIERLP